MTGGSATVLVVGARSLTQPVVPLNLCSFVVTVTWWEPSERTELGSGGQPLLPYAVTYIRPGPAQVTNGLARSAAPRVGGLTPGGSPFA